MAPTFMRTPLPTAAVSYLIDAILPDRVAGRERLLREALLFTAAAPFFYGMSAALRNRQRQVFRSGADNRRA